MLEELKLKSGDGQLSPKYPQCDKDVVALIEVITKMKQTCGIYYMGILDLYE